MSPRENTQKFAKTITTIDKKSKGFTEEERAAMKERVLELKAEARGDPRANKNKADGESECACEDRRDPGIGSRHGHAAPCDHQGQRGSPSPKTWYGMPAYAKDGNVVCFFQSWKECHMNECFFCGPTDNPLTEEHVWPLWVYGRDVLLFIRREFDYQHGTENILKLLREVEARPTILTRARYRAFFETTQMSAEGKDGLANAFFNSFTIVGDGKDPNDHIAPEAIAAESSALKAGIEKVLLYANRNLAHRTPDWDVQPIMVPTDTDNALKAVQACFDRFYPLLTGKSMPQPTPAIQFDWEECFTHPWLTPEVVAKINEADRAEREAKANGVLEGIKNRVQKK